MFSIRIEFEISEIRKACGSKGHSNLAYKGKGQIAQKFPCKRKLPNKKS